VSLDWWHGLSDHRVIMALNNCIQSIISLVERGEPNAFKLSIAEADAYLGSFHDVRGTKARRDELVAALRKELPRCARADQILEAIEQGSGEERPGRP
jgi:hypothetical protein